jgi:hypothetical protein
MSISFSIERSDRAFYARANGGAKFFVGHQTAYFERSSSRSFEGLFNVPSRELPKNIYVASDYRDAYGFWADFIEPTALCEGGNFLTLNTYDRARFTWGFGQFAAHVPDGDFVRFFRDMLGRPEAPDYFPNLHISAGRIAKLEGERLIPLETATGTAPLMDFLNPSSDAIEDAEVIAAAKLIHWTMNVSAVRELQVLHMVAAFKRMMAEADRRLSLHGQPADLCCVVCDIRHQGRANYAAMQSALMASDPLRALLKLGSIAYESRIRKLKAALAASNVVFSNKRWDREAREFV